MAEVKKTTRRATRKPAEEAAEVKHETVAETSAQPEEKQYSEADVQKMIQEAVKAALANAAPSPTVMVKEETVRVVFMGGVCRDNILQFGKFGSIYGPFGAIDIPRSSFGGEFMRSWVRKMLDERSLVVTDGMTDSERMRYGVAYKPGEVLTEQEYENLLDMDADTLCKRFSEVCEHFRRLIASVIEDARAAGDRRVNRETIERLNKISKEINAQIYPVNDIRRMGAFAHTLREMGIVS